MALGEYRLCITISEFSFKCERLPVHNLVHINQVWFELIDCVMRQMSQERRWVHNDLDCSQLFNIPCDIMCVRYYDGDIRLVGMRILVISIHESIELPSDIDK